MPAARADVATDAPGRYAAQLLSHLGHRLPVEVVDGGERLVFDVGSCDLLVGDAGLVLLARADTAEGLDRVTDVVGRHLVRFGRRNSLVVTWEPDPS